MSNFSARVLADSTSPDGIRLTTMEVTIPRLILPEFNTHRMLSRNSASSRAIPVKKQIEKIIDHPFIPEKFGIDQPGMQSSKFLQGKKHEAATFNVMVKRDRAIIGALEDLIGTQGLSRYFDALDLAGILLDGFTEDDITIVKRILDDYQEVSTKIRKNPEEAENLNEGFLGIHKQTLNRYLEPFMWQTIVVSATEWENFFNLRIHPDAQSEIAIPVRLMKLSLEASTPVDVDYGQWHLPLIQDDERELINESNIEDWKRVSAGRCARVSYLTHDGVRDTAKDILLCESLAKNWHMSPLEHVATPVESGYGSDTGNFIGWLQLRKQIPNEAVFPGAQK